MQLAVVLAAVSAAMLSLRRRARRRRHNRVSRVLRVVACLPNTPARRSRIPIHVVDMEVRDFVSNFRFEKADFPVLIDAYNIPPTIRTDCRVVVSAWDALGVFLRRLSKPGPWDSHEAFFGRTARVLRSCFSEIMNIVYLACNDRVTRPSTEFLNAARLQRFAEAIRRYENHCVCAARVIQCTCAFQLL
jgi:hypothetical protein